MISFHKQISACLTALALCVTAAGCSGEPKFPMGSVTGKLEIDGAAPKDKVRVMFVDSIQGFGGSALTEPDGSYSIKDLRLGEYVVYLEKSGGVVNGDSSNGEISTDADRLNSVPARYRTEASSPLRKKIVEGENTFDIEIKKTQPKK